MLQNNKAADRAVAPGLDQRHRQYAIRRAGIIPVGYSAHSVRAGFVTYARLRGASDRAIAHQTRHRSLATLGGYVRIRQAREDNAATTLAL